MECNEVRKTRDISVTEFCAEKGVSEKSYWYYHKKIGDQLATTISQNMDFIAIQYDDILFSTGKDLHFFILRINTERHVL